MANPTWFDYEFYMEMCIRDRLYSYLEITLISRCIKMQIGSCVPCFLDRVGNSESKNRGTMLDKMLGRMCNVY